MPPGGRDARIFRRAVGQMPASEGRTLARAGAGTRGPAATARGSPPPPRGWLGAGALALLAALAVPHEASAASAARAEESFARHCARCHGAERLGGTGPALLPGNLRRLRRAAAAR